MSHRPLRHVSRFIVASLHDLDQPVRIWVSDVKFFGATEESTRAYLLSVTIVASIDVTNAHALVHF
jgi:hypothetical protein